MTPLHFLSGSRVRAALTMMVASLAFSSGCADAAGPADQPGPDGSELSASDAAPVAQPPAARLTVAAHESAALPVSITWASELQGHLSTTSTGFSATLTNQSERALEVGVVALGSHADAPAATSIGAFTLKAGESRELVLPLADVPVQAHNAAVPIKLIAMVYDGDKRIQIPSSDLSVSFDPSYLRAFASAKASLGPAVAAKHAGDLANPHVAALLATPADEAPSAASVRAALGEPSQRFEATRGRLRTGSEPWQALERMHPFGTSGTSAVSISGTHIDSIKAPGLIWPPIDLGFTAKVCARYSVKFVDANFGEDHLADGYYLPIGKNWWQVIWIATPVPARYAYLRVHQKSNGREVFNGHLDADGCAKLWLFANDTYSLTVQTKLKRDTTTVDVKYVYPKGIDYTCPSTTLRGREECVSNGGFQRDVWFARPASWAPMQEVTLDTDYDSETFRVAAVAGQMLNTPDHGFKADDTYPVWSNTGCPSITDKGTTYYWREACDWNKEAYFGLSVGVGAKDTTLEKYVVAHEIGHQMQDRRNVLASGNGYAMAPGLPAACRCDHVTVANQVHCLQSRHSWADAQIEGWAQFVAARTFNRSDESNCSFVYYKDMRWDDGRVTLPPNAVDCAAPTRWMDNHCPASSQSTEWDMLGFLRELERDGTDGLSMDDIYGIYAGTYLNTIDWTAFRASALARFGNNANEPRFLRVVSAAQRYGVDH